MSFLYRWFALRTTKAALYAHGPDAKKVAAALKLADMPDGLAVLVEALSKDDFKGGAVGRPATRIAAAMGLAKIGKPAIAHLAGPLTHRSSEVQRPAAGALADIADAGSFDTFVDLVRNDREDANVREAAIFGLGNIGDERAVGLLITLGENEKEQLSFLRRAAYAALACLGGARATEAITRAASSGDDYVRPAAAKALAALVQPLPDFTRRRVRVLERGTSY